MLVVAATRPVELAQNRDALPILLRLEQVFNFNGDLLSSHGPNELIGALYGLDPHGLDGICAALGAS